MLPPQNVTIHWESMKIIAIVAEKCGDVSHRNDVVTS
jgi:hypothetical protein